jgi:hypothetical protein
MRQRGVGEEPEYRRQQKIAAEHRQHAQQHKEIIRTIVTLTTSIDSMSAEHAASRQQAARHENGKRKRDWSTFGALVAAAAAAILTLIVSHCDNRAIIDESRTAATRQHTDTVEALGKTDAAIGALQAQQSIMHSQLEIMTNELVLGKSLLQARLKRELKIERVIDNGVVIGWRITPIWMNVGATEAKDFIGWNVLNVFTPDVPNDFDFLHPNPLGQAPAGQVPVTIEPTQVIQQQTARISVNEANGVINKTAKIIAWGYGEYRDIFPDTPLHHKNWCVEILPLRSGGGMIQFSGPIIYKPECNRSD